MELTAMKLTEFVDVLASDSPAPGGGSAAALTGALGAGLVVMVAKLTIGKKKYAEHDALMKEIAKEAEDLTNKLTEYVDKDTAAYNAVSAVFSMPKNTDEEKAARSKAMQDALKYASKVPFEVMELCLAALKTAEKAVGTSNQNAASDLGVAALNLNAGINGAWLNVQINIAGIKDEDFVKPLRQNGLDMLDDAAKIAARINEGIQ